MKNELSRVLSDPTARNYALLSLIGAVVSSASAERLYRRLSETEQERSPLPLPVVLALGTGIATILYNVNKAHVTMSAPGSRKLEVT